MRLFSIAVLVVAAAQAGAQDVDAKLLQALKWRNIGPNRGGRSLATAGSPSRPHEYYFGAVGGGLWKTIDGGTTWKPVTDGQLKSSSVSAIAVSESNPDVVYIGMGETQLRGNIMQGDGVYKSEDAGKTWTHVGLADTQAIARVRVHPKDPDLVYVAALGHPYGPNDERGVFKSTDGGKTWKKVLFRSNKAGAVDLVIDRNDPSVLFASTWEVFRTPWQLSSGGPGSGLFKSTDAGETWKEITRSPGLPKGIVGKIGVSISGADSKRVFAMVENEDGGLYRSDDAGATWTRVNDERALRQRAFYYTRVYADPKEKDTVYVLNVNFHKSSDGGKTFKRIRPPHGDNHDLWIDPSDSLRMSESNDGGGTVSVNGGETWTPLDYPTAQLYHVTTTRDFPYHVCGAQQDNSTLCVPSDGGPNLRNPSQPAGDHLYAVGGGESGYIAPHPTNPDLFYAGSQGALLTRYNRKTGKIRDIQVYPEFFSGQSAATLKQRWQWTFPIVFSPHDSNVLYTSSQHLWKTTNDGLSWERISPDLTRADPKTLGDSGGPITKDQNGPEIYATIFTVAPSKLEKDTIWTGSDDGLAHVTRDGGKTWTKVTPKELPEFSRISIIDASPHKPGTAYLCAKRYQLDDRAPYIFKTDDYGKTWGKIVAGIREDDYIHVVREDPKRPGLLYAGGEHGVWVSWDDGASWQSLALNLPDVQVSDLVVEENDLVIGTHGRSFYLLEDIGPLRQMKPEVATAAVHLFVPRDAVRGYGNAVIDYVLAKDSDKVTVEILDPAGKLVRSFVGTPDDDKKKDGGADDSEFFGPAAPPPPPRKAGLNRFQWNLRHHGATTFPGMIIWSARPENGPLAVPGPFRVKVSANGDAREAPLVVKLDPRTTGVTIADLQEQFDLASRVRDATSRANEAVIRIRALKDQIRDRVQKTKDKGVASSGDALARKLGAVEEELYQVRNRSGQDPLNFPIKLNNKLAALRRSIETGDGKPTAGSLAVWKEQSAQLQALVARLDNLVKVDVVQYNLALESKKLPPLK